MHKAASVLSSEMAKIRTESVKKMAEKVAKLLVIVACPVPQV